MKGTAQFGSTAPLFLLDPPSPYTARHIARIAAAFASFCTLLWLLVIAILWTAEPLLVFRTDLSRQSTRAFDSNVFHETAFPTSGGLSLHAVVLRHGGDGVTAKWVLYCPPAGASTHVARIQGELQDLWAFGYNVFAFDYRGFGYNSGEPSEKALYADAAAAYRHLTDAFKLSGSRIILAGRSLGSAVAVELASHVESAGLLLLSPIDSVPLAGARLYPWVPVSLLATNRFDNTPKLERLRSPVVFVHAVDDWLVPPDTARALFRHIAAPKLRLETGGDHHSAGFAGEGGRLDLRDAMRRFWATG
jgi:pimeloyl-ACP methyl ester carboxylesterase